MSVQGPGNWIEEDGCATGQKPRQKHTAWRRAAELGNEEVEVSGSTHARMMFSFCVRARARCVALVPTAAQQLSSFSLVLSPHTLYRRFPCDDPHGQERPTVARVRTHTGALPLGVQQLMRVMMKTSAAAESGPQRHLECGRVGAPAQGAPPRDVGDLAARIDDECIIGCANGRCLAHR